MRARRLAMGRGRTGKGYGIKQSNKKIVIKPNKSPSRRIRVSYDCDDTVVAVATAGDEREVNGGMGRRERREKSHSGRRANRFSRRGSQHCKCYAAVDGRGGGGPGRCKIILYCGVAVAVAAAWGKKGEPLRCNVMRSLRVALPSGRISQRVYNVRAHRRQITSPSRAHDPSPIRRRSPS